ncbi:MAG: riboflavin biosynthesis protein [Herpetosiphonaceae bacterium]|nr:MAG: riboflavin biosynthesis protein [Herpetosiphonaceae bacterium]
MQLIRGIQELTPNAPIVLTIGNYDGVHLGHQHVIGTMVARAREREAQSAVMTFDPHTDHVLHPERNRRLLTSIEERAAIIEALGVDLLIVMPFDHELARLSAEQFMQLIRSHLQLCELWDGPDFRLGYKAQGTMDKLAEIGKRLGYSVHIVEPFLYNGQRVSSTRVRELLESGQVSEARILLGRPFSFEGRVVEGDRRGRSIGVPTANLEVPPEHVLPMDGVYACWATIGDLAGGSYRAVVNIGVRPTFGVPGRTVEAHLLDFSGDLYGRRVRLAFIERLRGERKFPGIEALVQQIKADIVSAQQLLDKG